MWHLIHKSKHDQDISFDRVTTNTIDLVGLSNYQTNIWKMANVAIYEIRNPGKSMDIQWVEKTPGVQMK